MWSNLFSAATGLDSDTDIAKPTGTGVGIRTDTDTEIRTGGGSDADAVYCYAAKQIRRDMYWRLYTLHSIACYTVLSPTHTTTLALKSRR